MSTAKVTQRQAARTAHVGARPLLFWTLLFLLNLCLFLPAYILDHANSTPFPALSGDLAADARRLLVWRENLDPWRLNLELVLLSGAAVFLSPLRRSRWRRLFLAAGIVVYLAALLYAVYESVSLSFYHEDPVFYDQAQFVIEGLPFLLRHLALSPWLLAAAAAAAVLSILALAALLRLLFAEQQARALGLLSKAVLVALLVLVVVSFLRNGRLLAAPRSAISCLGCKLDHNIRSSLASADRVRAVARLDQDHSYDYGGYGLLAKPDIYLIFIESYGGVLYQHPQLRDPYLALLAETEDALQDDGWHAATILSESPSWGGGSWMAYTSTFFGMRVDSHPAYLTLLDRFDDGSFPHLGRTLQEMGYFHGRVTALPAQVSDEQWQQYQRFFNTDRWLRYEDLAYQGPHFGWGPAPPDQFVLGEANDLLQAAAGSQPLLLFLITQNSHYPWQEIPQLVTDRRTLNDGSGKDVQPNLQTPRVDVSLDDYMAAITYELRFLSRFIAEDAHDQAIFILVGDHQPGYITRKADGYQTPLHIISKDQALLDKVAAYGFQPGMLASDALARMKHEGFYSLFMRALLERYGRGDRLPPPYLPQGLPLWPAQAADQQTGS